MENKMEIFLQQAKKNRKKRKISRHILTILSLLVASGVIWQLRLTGITMSNDAHCGFEEHRHGESCQTKTLICGYEEQETQSAEWISVCTSEEHTHSEACFVEQTVLVCGQGHTHGDACYTAEQVLSCTDCGEEHEHGDGCYSANTVLSCTLDDTHVHGDECYETQTVQLCEQSEHSHSDVCWEYPASGSENAHVHTDACYEIVCSCDLAEHIHTSGCYSDPDADVEAAVNWEATLPNTLTGNWAEDLIAVAKSQLGYTESTRNYTVTEDGAIKGYTRYGAWYGNPYGDWGTMFVSFCLRYAGVPVSVAPDAAGAYAMLVGMTDLGRCKPVSLAQPGDILFLDADGNGVADGTAIVISVDADTVQVIQGDAAQQVMTLSYSLRSGSLLACGGLSQETRPTETGEAEPDAETQPTEVAEETVPMEETEPSEEPEAAEETQSAVDPYAGLPVMGTVTVEGTRPAVAMFTTMSVEEETSAPIDLEETKGGYITKITVFYKRDDGEWTEVENGTALEGDDAIRLEVEYEDVPIADLKKAGYTMTYTLPDWLRNVTADGKITSGGEGVGTITVNGNTVTLKFDPDWVDKQTDTVLKGDFYVEAALNLSYDWEKENVIIGDVSINLEDTSNLVAQYGALDIEKSTPVLIQDKNGDYLEYTLTVTAGQDGCPDVKVMDSFTANSNYVAEYVGVTGTLSEVSSQTSPTGSGQVCLGTLTENTETGTMDIIVAGGDYTKPGTLVWEIGNMTANESRTLTYRVKLTEDYLKDKQNNAVTNGADVYSQTYKRDLDYSKFEPKPDGDMRKTAGTPQKQDDGSYIIPYTVWVENKSNYMLRDMRLADALNHSANSTDSALLPYLSYVEGSWRLYKGKNATEGNFVSDWPVTDNNPTMKDDGKGFIFYLGDMKPGDSYTITYEVRIDPEAFAVMGNSDFLVKNRARYITPGTVEWSTDMLLAYNVHTTISHREWAEKQAGTELTEEETVTISANDAVYTLNDDGKYDVLDSPPTSFTVPVGGYQYTVTVNEDGSWDMSQTNMSDDIQSEYMNFVGYVRVDAYKVTADGTKNLTKTVWLKPGKTNFSFTPTDIGLTEKNYAYTLTYYAQPVQTEQITQIIVGNEFHITGDVGIGDKTYTLAKVTVNASVTVSGSNSFAAQKQSWYYDASTGGNYPNGALYWVIKAEGNFIPSGTAFQDVITVPNGGTQHSLHNDSIVGVFTASLPEGVSLTDYASWEYLQTDNVVLTNVEYTTEVTGQSAATVTLTQEVTLSDGEALYIVVKTAPSKIPASDRDTNTFYNSLKTKDSSSDDWMDQNEASKILYGSKNIFKELGRVFTYDASSNTKTDITNYKGGDVYNDDLPGSGTYIAWVVKVNYEGGLSGGPYEIIDDLPDGVELVYVRLKWRGANAGNVEMVRQTPTPDGWNEGSVTADLDSASSGTRNDYTSYYYVSGDGSQVKWYASGYQALGTFDSCSTDFQILCRVTDESVLQGGQEVEFNNNVTLKNPDGTPIGTDSDGVSISRETLDKEGTYDPETNGGHYPFKLQVNPLGEDLSSGDTITLVDEMSPLLVLDPGSIRVVNTNTGAEVEFTASVESADSANILRIVLPDDQPLTITYTTTVNAAPGQTVSISNSARYEGYAASENGSVEVEEFSYTVGGTVGTETTPRITITKYDRNHATTTLPGAAFQLKKCTVSEDGATISPTDTVWTGTTGEDGTLTFGTGTDDDPVMEYNTVYCLTETKAPDGYVLDPTPRYFVVVNEAVEEGTYPDGVSVYGQSATYAYTAYNRKGEIRVEKKFQTPEKGEYAPIDGTYNFGLFSDEAGKNKLQTGAITVTNGVASPLSLIFKDLDLDKDYYVYELDATGAPILSDGLFETGGHFFQPVYETNPATPTSAAGTVTVTIINTVYGYELPQSGGMGTLPYSLCGGGFAAWSLVTLLRRKRKKQEEETPT